MTINEFLNRYNKSARRGDTIYKQSPRVQMHSGLKLSIQASRNHKCAPTDNKGPYTEVELGFPNYTKKLHSLKEFAENPGDLKNTVYMNVPVERADKLLQDNGGINERSLRYIWRSFDI